MIWATPGALPSLETLVVSANNLSGSLPAEWGSTPGAFPMLTTLDVRQNGLVGYLPAAWGTGFQVHAPEAISIKGERCFHIRRCEKRSWRWCKALKARICWCTRQQASNCASVCPESAGW